MNNWTIRRATDSCPQTALTGVALVDINELAQVKQYATQGGQPMLACLGNKLGNL